MTINKIKPNHKLELRSLILSNHDIDTLDYSHIKDFAFLFEGCSIVPCLKKLDTSNVSNMRFMFRNCHGFNQNINHFNMSNVTDIGGMFYHCSSFNQPLDNWDISNVIDMAHLFSKCRVFNQDISMWNTSPKLNLSTSFKDTENLLFKNMKGVFSKLIKKPKLDISYLSGTNQELIDILAVYEDIDLFKLETLKEQDYYYLISKLERYI